MQEYKIKLDTAIDELITLQNTHCNACREDNIAHRKKIVAKKIEIKEIAKEHQLLNRIIQLIELNII